MTNRAKAKGTRHESSIRDGLRAAGHWARRLAEEGARDEGDVEVQPTRHRILVGVDDDGNGVEQPWMCAHQHAALGRWWRIVVEAKAQANLSITEVVAKAARKAGGAPAPVWWRRLVTPAGGQRGQPKGEKEIVAMPAADFDELLRLLLDLAACPDCHPPQADTEEAA